MDTSTDTGGTLRFGAFELDVRSRELRRGDRLIRLQEQPFEILKRLRAALGDIRWMLEWDWRGAEAAYLQAIALNPGGENAHRRYGTMLSAAGRAAEAVADADPALPYLAVDPRFEPIRADARYGRLLELLCLT